jgi:Stress responsive A/B Barrel Domain
MLAELQKELSAVGVEQFTARDYRPQRVRHVVLFRYRAHVSESERREVAARFEELIESRRSDGGTYIESIDIGTQTSGEGAGHGFELGVIVTFASLGDRNYYVGLPVVEDPRYFDQQHAAFKVFVGPLLAEGGAGALVFDVAADPAVL